MATPVLFLRTMIEEEFVQNHEMEMFYDRVF